MSNSIYGFIALTGGAAGALDKIDGAGLADQDIAIGCAGGIFYAYILDDDSAAVESSPDVIAPNDNAGDKRWILQSTLPAAFDVLLYKGATDCSGNPNYPAADAGHCYIVSGAGKIGGAAGADVEIGDLFICNTDSTASGDQATVGTKWNIIQTNLDPTDYVTHALATAANDFLVASGAGVFVKKTLAETAALLKDQFPQAITDNHVVTVDSASAATGEYAKFTANGLESKSLAEVRADLLVAPGTIGGTTPGVVYATMKEIYKTSSAASPLTALQVSRTIVSNYGMTDADCVISLPTAAEGYTFICILPTVRAKHFKFRADTNDKIYLSGVAGSNNAYVGVASGYATGASCQMFTFKASDGGFDWFCIPIFGTWVAS